MDHAGLGDPLADDAGVLGEEHLGGTVGFTTDESEGTTDESEGTTDESEGTTFFLRLPVVPDEEPG